MTAMLTQKAFVKANDFTTIRCPHCNTVKTAPVGDYRYKHHTLKVRCICSETFVVALDFRKNYRKKTDLSGHYAQNAPAHGGGPIHISNISKTGVGFSVSGIHTLEIGQKARLDFILDNRKQTQLNKQVTIRSVSGNYIGCEFIDHRTFDKDLGFYLRP